MPFSPDIDVCRKTIKLALEMLSSRSVGEVVSFFTKEISKTHDPGNEKNSEYRQLLIHAIHQCAIKFPDVAADVVHVLMDFLGDSNSSSAVDVILFVRYVFISISLN
jgi:coatomer subunit beta